MSMEEQRLAMLKRLNDIDAQLTTLSKHAIAAAIAGRTRGLDRRQQRPVANQIRNEMLGRRQQLVAEKNTLTADYCRLKSMIRKQGEPQTGIVVRLLTAILKALGGDAAAASAPATAQPRARNTE